LERRVSNHQNRLLAFIERVETLNREIVALKEDVHGIMVEAKKAGFDPKIMRQMIKERGQDPAQVQEALALAELYRAALGMLDGTPLGEAARRRLAKPPPGDEATPGPADEPATPAQEPAAAVPEATPEAMAAARAEGATAARDGRKVTENPYPAGHALRACWDEGWCAEAGSDGMDVPAAWRRSKPKGKGDGKGTGE
jgi:uncharacterized protein (UPF0335 family)